MGDPARMALVGRRRPILVGLAGLLVAACGGSGGDRDAAGFSEASDEGLVAQVASYDLVVGRDQRFIVGLFSNDRGGVAFGE
ncbi:MAG TPA: hypothetical protein VE575_11100, partial [Acidimicrobiales bacterium]|nr:hypothetical protein [Acidimicrobiales bacterium]